MNGGRYRIENARVRTGREVHGNGRCRSDRTRHLDIQHHLAIRSIRIASWLVRGLVDRDRRDSGSLEAQAAEVRLDVLRLEAAAELDEGDAFARAIALREVIERGELHRSERRRTRTRRPRASPRVRCLHTKVRPGLRTVVESQYRLDDAVQLRRDMDGT